MLVTLDNVAFGYNDNLILNDVSFVINDGERIGLIGANGEGKTTLIKLILGELYADFGELNKKNGLKIGYLEQNGGYESGNTVYGEMLAVFREELSAVDRLCFRAANTMFWPLRLKTSINIFRQKTVSTLKSE